LELIYNKIKPGFARFRKGLEMGRAKREKLRGKKQ